MSLKRVVERLGEMEMTSAMIEAGAQLNSNALVQQAVDKLCLFYAPIFLGAAGVPLLNSIESFRPQMARVSVEQLGQDFCFEGYLRDPWV